MHYSKHFYSDCWWPAATSGFWAFRHIRHARIANPIVLEKHPKAATLALCLRVLHHQHGGLLTSMYRICPCLGTHYQQPCVFVPVFPGCQRLRVYLAPSYRHGSSQTSVFPAVSWACRHSSLHCAISCITNKSASVPVIHGRRLRALDRIKAPLLSRR